MKISYPNLKVISKKIAIVLLCVAVGWYLKGRFSPSGSGFQMGGEVYVLAKETAINDITETNNKISYVEAINDVNLLPKVTGTVEKVLFKEGSLVNEGDVLFEIEPDKYQAAYDLAKAQLDSTEANLVKAERDYNRQQKLSDQKFASKATFDTAQSAYLQAKAAVEEAKARLDVATLDLDYTKVKAPISGKIGKALVTEGNYVVASSQPLAKIVQVNPMRISFSLTDKEAIEVAEAKYEPENLRARITLPTSKTIDEDVVNLFIDNKVNAATATVAVYMDVDNSDGLLIPGNYVQTAVITGKTKQAVTIPQTAINYDQQGAFVYVVKVNKEKSSDTEIHGTAEQRRVELGDVVNESEQAVLSGLKDKELIIVQGSVKLQNNSPVKVGIIK